MGDDGHTDGWMGLQMAWMDSWMGGCWALLDVDVVGWAWMGHRCVRMCPDGRGCAADGCGWALIGLDGANGHGRVRMDVDGHRWGWMGLDDEDGGCVLLTWQPLTAAEHLYD